ncbi:MAG: tryptophan-rich sensory protein [Verrucomicrobiae bacterium]|nr:tryptophan-rich sensory protein [Verrucomicrobiae bacterium]MBT8411621.1 tryptophan-rich sensory protein [Octadecabacter sp.]NNJ86864.1 tryptophan-rich sensory protein [Akkermansiaceae bacterium]
MRSLPAKIILSAIIMLMLGGLGSYFTSSSIASWYVTLERPPGTPPNWLFGPVWSILYILIGISFALVWQCGKLGKNRHTFYFLAQLILNLAWSPVFFGAQQIVPALVVIVLMWIFIALTIRAFARVSQPAAYLLVPYLVWVSYATYLNAGYAWLN